MAASNAQSPSSTAAATFSALPPGKLLGRERQQAFFLQFLRIHINLYCNLLDRPAAWPDPEEAAAGLTPAEISEIRRSPASIYLYGAPGTGKTQLLNTVLAEELPQLFETAQMEVSVGFLNCMSLPRHSLIFAKLLELVSGAVPPASTKGEAAADYQALVDYLGRSEPPAKRPRQRKDTSVSPAAARMNVLIIDEIDELSRATSDKQILYRLFEIPQRCPGTVLVCASNLLDLSARLQLLECELYRPIALQFPTYSRADLIAIFNSRIERLQARGITVNIDPRAVQLLATRVANESGDIRKLLQLGTDLLTLTPAGESITVAKVAAAWSAANQNSLAGRTAALVDCPLHPLIALVACLQCRDELEQRMTPAKPTGRSDATSKLVSEPMAESKYRALCRQTALTPVRFHDLLDHLVTVELLSTEKKRVKTTTQTVLSPNVQWDDLVAASSVAPNPTMAMLLSPR